MSITTPDANPEVLQLNEDNPMESIVKCPFCGRESKAGDLRMISGYVGCDYCFFKVPDGLEAVVLDKKKNDPDDYVAGYFYKHGFRHCKEKEHE